MQRERDNRDSRERSLNGSQLQELVIEYLWLYFYGHFHYAWYFTWYAHEMQYLCFKTKARLLAGAFVCKHDVIVCNAVLSEYFKIISTQKDELRWVILSPENVDQLISYYHISGTLEHIPKSNQVIIIRTVAQNKWRVMMHVEGMPDEIGIVY